MLVGIVGTMLVTMVGCTSVEGTRAQLASSNSAQVAKAENNIYQVAIYGTTTGFDSYEMNDRIAFVGLTKNPDLLLKIVNESRSDEIRLAALQQLPIDKTDVALKTLTKVRDVQILLSEKDEKGQSLCEKCVSALPEHVLVEMVESNRAGKSPVREDKRRPRVKIDESYRMDSDVGKVIVMHLAKTSQNAEVLKQIVLSKFYFVEKDAENAALNNLKSNHLDSLAEIFIEAPWKVADALDESLLAEFLMKVPPVRPGTGSDYRSYVSKISNQELLKKIYRTTKDEHVQYDCMNKITDKSFIKSFKAELARKAEKKILSKFQANPVFADEKDAENILNTEIAEYLLEHGDFSKLESRTEYTYGVRMEYPDSYQAARIIAAIVKRLSPEKVKSLADEAVKRAEAKKDSAIVLGGYYLGMPALDFFVLSRVRKVNPDWGYKTIAQEKDWRQRFVVDSFEFKAKDRVAVLDCEDSLVLQQTIHQCVKHEKGKAKSYDYLKEINHDIKLEKSWDGKKLEGSLWEEYVNTKLNAKIRYNKAEGKLVFTER